MDSVRDVFWYEWDYCVYIRYNGYLVRTCRKVCVSIVHLANLAVLFAFLTIRSSHGIEINYF